jgi:hypothetical protein
MKKNKLNVWVMSIELMQESQQFKLVESGNHNLTFDEIKDTIHESIDLQFEDLEKKMEETGREFDGGVIIMPLIKINFKKD